MPVADILEIKKNNVRAILHEARIKESITKKELTEITGLSAATVSNICNELADEGVFTYTKDDTHAVGRNPKIISFNYNRYYTLAINIALLGKQTLTLVNGIDEIVLKKAYFFDEELSAEELAQRLFEQYKKDFEPNIGSNSRIISLGIAVSGIFDTEEMKLVASPNKQFIGADIKKIFSVTFGMKTFVDEISNLCALSTLVNRVKNVNSVYLYCSEKLGLGIVIDGKLYSGKRGYAGEIEEIASKLEERKLDGILSIDGILRKYYGNVPKNKQQAWESFLEFMRNGDNRAIEIIREYGLFIGKVIYCCALILDPDEIVVGATISFFRDYMIETSKTEAIRLMDPWRKKYPKVVWDDNSRDAANIGIAEKAFSEWMPI